MRVQPMLGDWVVPRLATVETVEDRDFRELPVPGRAGSVFVDHHRRPARILLAGSLFGEQARDAFLEQVRGKFDDGAPVEFVADILTATDIGYVLIERLEFAERADAPDQVDYLIQCVESPPPPPPPSPLGDIDAGLLADAAGVVDGIGDALAAIDALAVPGFGDPTAALSGVLDGAGEAIAGLSGAADALTTLFGQG